MLHCHGSITTDANSNAIVELPEWFEALDQDFRYKLTVIGQCAHALVARRISNHCFAIRTDKPNVEVSWLVTGIRHDAWAEANRIQVEEPKNGQGHGRFLHPELHGAGPESPTSELYKPGLHKAMLESEATHKPMARISGAPKDAQAIHFDPGQK
jgi:hypothetical protein